MRSIDDSLKRLQPLYDFVTKLPFFKKWLEGLAALFQYGTLW
jgi:hypothetical protein